jgi:hypothetical protein
LGERGEAEVAPAAPQFAERAFMPFGDRGAVFDDGRIQGDVVLLQGQADDRPGYPLARPHLVLEGPVADQDHLHAGAVGLCAGVKPPFQAGHRFTDEGVHCLQVRFPGAIGVKVLVKRISLHFEHAPNFNSGI